MDSNGYMKFRDRGKGENLMRRVQGFHDLRLDGISDLLHRASGKTVFDIGCNRGLAGFEFANNGASRVMGCDIFEDGVICARHLFSDLRAVSHRFEVVNLSGGYGSLKAAFGKEADWGHDIVLMLATYHKLRRIEGNKAWLPDLMRHFGKVTQRYFGWRGYEEEIPELDKLLGEVGLIRIHTSLISDIQPAAIWARK